MSDFKLIITYSARLALRQWRQFVLPFLSLSVTTVVLLLMLLLTASGELLLLSQAKELQGGDVVLESNEPLVSEKLWTEIGLIPDVATTRIEFSGTLASALKSASFSIQVIDSNYPLYGGLVLSEGIFQGVKPGEIYLDRQAMERLAVKVGDTVSLGAVEMKVSGVVVAEPTSLLGGFRFLPRVYLSPESFAASQLDPALLRAEYTYAAKFTDDLTSEDISRLRVFEEEQGIDVNISGQDRRGLQFGLSTVSDFLVVAVLITAVLATVNVYASTIYLVTVERRSLAILLALGLTKNKLFAILGTALLYVVLLALLIGVLLGAMVFAWLQDFVFSSFLIKLPAPDLWFYAGLTALLTLVITVASFVPAVKSSLSLSPKAILVNQPTNTDTGFTTRTLLTVTIFTLLPLTFLTIYLLKEVGKGLLVILVIIALYSIVAVVFVLLLNYLYKKRARLSFFWRSILSQKVADGIFGIVSFTSLFVALLSLTTLILVQSSLASFLKSDLATSVPTTYILDVQPSQKDLLLNSFREVDLFANLRARIVSIDDLVIEEELRKSEPSIDRELSREFNLTARDYLLSSEEIVGGSSEIGKKGEVSVDEDFAKRAGISLGSQIRFLIQGFPVEVTVTSFRLTDSRSGLPFFYFVLSEEDIGQFPQIYFGYAYYEEAVRAELGKFLADNMPNVTILETAVLGSLVIGLVETLLILVLFVTVPPLIIATLLIATLVVFSYADRRREGGRLRALGANKNFVFIQYLAETLSLSVIAITTSYLLSVFLNYIIGIYFLELDRVVYISSEVFYGFALILALISVIAFYLFKTDTMPLRELLSYETNR